MIDITVDVSGLEGIKGVIDSFAPKELNGKNMLVEIATSVCAEQLARIHQKGLKSDGTAIGTGLQNTIDIVNNCTSSTGYAASVCDSLLLNGYTDWFLPSKEELHLMYSNLKLFGTGNFSNSAYWSSSEMTSVFAWQVIFTNGLTQGTSKNSFALVRPIRVF